MSLLVQICVSSAKKWDPFIRFLVSYNFTNYLFCSIQCLTPFNMLSDDDNATPTTRFIRNCEAVGLFNDLPPNPFEETFRLATASDLPHSFKVNFWTLNEIIWANKTNFCSLYRIHRQKWIQKNRSTLPEWFHPPLIKHFSRVSEIEYVRFKINYILSYFLTVGAVIDDDEDVIVLNDFLEPILPDTPHIPR